METNSIKVKIGGTEYALRSDSDPDYLKELAEFIDNRMRNFEGTANLKSPVKIAVLTALNIADDYFRLKKKHEKLVNEIESTSEEIAENLDNYLNHYSVYLK